MAELEIDLNQRVGEWDSIQETGKVLTPLFGPGYTGLANLGNSCYLNSVVQVLFTLPGFQQRCVSSKQNVRNFWVVTKYELFIAILMTRKPFLIAQIQALTKISTYKCKICFACFE